MSIFRKYDIRGIAGKELTEDFARSLGVACSRLLLERIPSARAVSVGRDVRLSSPALASGLMEGIISTGLDVHDLGVCPTPLQYFSLFTLPVDGGIMVTGSHNPPEFNGFKVSIGKETIHGEDILMLRDLLPPECSSPSGSPGRIIPHDIISSYTKHMLEEFSGLRDSRTRLRVVLDAGNGTAGLVMPALLRELGCEVIPLYDAPDGTFPNHHPDPTVIENMKDLREEVLRQKAAIGIGYDGDADRIGVVSEDGSLIWGDQIMIILSREILRHHPGASIIGDVKCSQTLFDDVLRHGGRPVMARTGHSLIKARMKEEGALLAGEFSGHIFLADRYFGFDDALYTSLRLIEIMVKTGRPVGKLLEGIPRLSFTPEIRVDTPDSLKQSLVSTIVNRLKGLKEKGSAPFPIREIQDIDGARVVFDRGWALIRASNTQPVVVIRVEATDDDHLHAYRELLEAQYRQALSESRQ
jgi:phosphomannomutase/phosphoglucomutase